MAWKPTRREFLLITGAASLTFPFSGRGEERQAVKVIVNPYEAVDWETFKHHKAALHLHTLQSDGFQMPDRVIRGYRRAGYDIMAISDHDFFEPNRQVVAGNLPEEAASPYPEEPLPDNYPANPTWPWSDYGSEDPPALDMVGIVSNELTGRHHINSYFNDFGLWKENGTADADGNPMWEDDIIEAVRERNGLAILDHPWWSSPPTWERRPLDWYIERYLTNSPDCLVGIEVTNCGAQHESYDEGLWDQLLVRFMPNRPIWGFGTDDMHHLDRARESYSVFVLPELTSASARQAMATGQFYFCKSSHHLDYTQEDPDRIAFPRIEAIEVDDAGETIQIHGQDYDQIAWISAPVSLEPVDDYQTSDEPWPQGEVVHFGETLNIRDTPYIRNYVRAELRRSDDKGTHRTFTNPFGIEMA